MSDKEALIVAKKLAKYIVRYMHEQEMSAKTFHVLVSHRRKWGVDYTLFTVVFTNYYTLNSWSNKITRLELELKKYFPYDIHFPVGDCYLCDTMDDVRPVVYRITGYRIEYSDEYRIKQQYVPIRYRDGDDIRPHYSRFKRLRAQSYIPQKWR